MIRSDFSALRLGLLMTGFSLCLSMPAYASAGSDFSITAGRSGSVTNGGSDGIALSSLFGGGSLLGGGLFGGMNSAAASFAASNPIPFSNINRSGQASGGTAQAGGSLFSNPFVQNLATVGIGVGLGMLSGNNGSGSTGDLGSKLLMVGTMFSLLSGQNMNYGSNNMLNLASNSVPFGSNMGQPSTSTGSAGSNTNTGTNTGSASNDADSTGSNGGTPGQSSGAAGGAYGSFDSAKAILKSQTDDAGGGFCGRGTFNVLKDQGYRVTSGDGHDWARNLEANGWTLVPNVTPQNAPVGAVLVYNSDVREGNPARNTGGGTYGHVEVVASDNGSRVYVSDKARSNFGGTVPDNFMGAYVCMSTKCRTSS